MKTALVTGGSRGIGKAICDKLSQDTDYHILINYRSNKEEALNTLSLVESNGNSGEIIQFDVANQEDVHKKLDAWQKSKPKNIIEVLINNAGITKDGLFMWMPKDDWDQVLNVSLGGFFNVTNYLMQTMLRNKYGRIINMVSVSGMKGTPGQTNYSAAKGAIISATKALAQEVAKRKITVNAVAPGFIKSDMTSDLDEKELKKMIPMQRFGEVDEVADLVNFLASKKASYITGEIININGGIYS